MATVVGKARAPRSPFFAILLCLIGLAIGFFAFLPPDPSRSNSIVNDSERCVLSCLGPDFERMVKQISGIKTQNFRPGSLILLDPQLLKNIESCREWCTYLEQTPSEDRILPISELRKIYELPNQTLAKNRSKITVWFGIEKASLLTQPEHQMESWVLNRDAGKNGFKILISRLRTKGAKSDPYWLAKQHPLGDHTLAVVRPNLSPFWNGTFFVPTELGLFRWRLQHSRFLECNHKVARIFRKENPVGERQLPLEKAGKALMETRELTHQLRIAPMLWDGTLLGWYRECDLIPHTNDIDMAFHIQEYNSILEWKYIENCEMNFIMGKASDGLEIRTYLHGVNLDIFGLFQHNDGGMVTGGGSTATRQRLLWHFPRVNRTKCAAELLGHLLQVPCNPVEILLKAYGPNFTVKAVASDQYQWRTSGRNIENIRPWTSEEWQSVWRMPRPFHCTSHELMLPILLIAFFISVVLLALWRYGLIRRCIDYLYSLR